MRDDLHSSQFNIQTERNCCSSLLPIVQQFKEFKPPTLRQGLWAPLLPSHLLNLKVESLVKKIRFSCQFDFVGGSALHGSDGGVEINEEYVIYYQPRTRTASSLIFPVMHIGTKVLDAEFYGAHILDIMTRS